MSHEVTSRRSLSSEKLSEEIPSVGGLRRESPKLAPDIESSARCFYRTQLRLIVAAPLLQVLHQVYPG